MNKPNRAKNEETAEQAYRRGVCAGLQARVRWQEIEDNPLLAQELAFDLINAPGDHPRLLHEIVEVIRTLKGMGGAR